MGKPRWHSVETYLRYQAAEGVYPVRYGALATMMTVFQGSPVHRRHLAGMLNKVHKHCQAEGWPDLTAFLVGKDGVPGKGWAGWAEGLDPALERKKAHEFFRKTSF